MPQPHKIYKITLTPLGPFFFGGENVFGSKDAQSDRRRSYLVASNVLPQQTTLLGMLRYQLLAQNDLLLDVNSNAQKMQAAKDLVGERSFSPGHTSGYGIIQRLSPLFIADESGAIWQPAPLDDQQVADKAGVLQPLRFVLDAGGYPMLQNLNPKVGLHLQFGNAAGQRKSATDFFGEVSQVGITMSNRVKHKTLLEEDRKEGYYYQTFRSNTQSAFAATRTDSVADDTYHFVFYAALDTNPQYQFSDALVQLGGERSVFKMAVSPTDSETLVGSLPPAVQYVHHQLDGTYNHIRRIVLQNDTYADWPILRDNSLFVVGHPTPFRHFSSVLGTTQHFNDLKNGANHTARTQSTPYMLLQRGAVLYVASPQKLDIIKRHIEAQHAFANIGYNQFHII